MPEASDPTFKEGAVEGRSDNWGEVVTRQPYRKVRLDHLLSKEEEVRVLYTVQVSRETEEILVPMRPWETPVPIPNTTVKTWAAENTILETIWEDRWVPDPI